LELEVVGWVVGLVGIKVVVGCEVVGLGEGLLEVVG